MTFSIEKCQVIKNKAWQICVRNERNPSECLAHLLDDHCLHPSANLWCISLNEWETHMHACTHTRMHTHTQCQITGQLGPFNLSGLLPVQN